MSVKYLFVVGPSVELIYVFEPWLPQSLNRVHRFSKGFHFDIYRARPRPSRSSLANIYRSLRPKTEYYHIIIVERYSWRNVITTRDPARALGIRRDRRRKRTNVRPRPETRPEVIYCRAKRSSVTKADRPADSFRYEKQTRINIKRDRTGVFIGSRGIEMVDLWSFTRSERVETD